MERTYLEHLLTSDQLLVSLGGPEQFTALPEFGLSTLKFNRLPFMCTIFYNCNGFLGLVVSSLFFLFSLIIVCFFL